jgi:Ran GTPase-activating protein (RanGAP) involved in mRNA processing and transport
MKYERMLFGMKILDATNLSHLIKNTRTLTSLWLPSNQIDDDLLRMIMSGLVKNCTITSFDFSHNKITNHGARLLAKLLGPDSVITSLNLCDNQIHAEGGRYLSRGLKYNTSLVELNLRLNRLTDEGGRMLIEGLAEHRNLTILNLSNNMLGKETAEAFADVFADPKCTLRCVDLSGNVFSEEHAEILLHGLQQNTSIIALDLRQNEIAQESDVLARINQKIRSNEIEYKQSFQRSG